MRIWIDYQDDDDEPSRAWNVEVIPRIGEKVGSRPISEQSPDTFYLDYVVDVRHYEGEIRVMTSSRR